MKTSSLRSFLPIRSGFLILVSGISTTHAILDTNENGLSDIWEKAYNDGDLLPETLDLLSDPDGDGWSNQQEAIAGTNPFDANSPLGHVATDILHSPATFSGVDGNGDPILLTPEAVTITWPTLAGKLYTLQFSPNLQAGTWINVQEPIFGDGTPVSIVAVLTQPNGSTPDSLFWHVKISDADTDGDGLVNAEEAALNSNPLVDDRNLDADEDGLTNFEEFLLGSNPDNENTDGDSLNDFEDAAPKEALISWRRTSESAYAMVEIDAPAATYLPQDLADSGEVLFANGRWKNGVWVSLDAPLKTGSISTSGDPITYDEHSYGWFRFNSSLQALGSMTITFTSGQPAGGDPIGTSSFWIPGTPSPINLTESAGIWNTSYPALGPVGISNNGQTVVLARDANPTPVKHYKRFDINGAVIGRMDGISGYEPISYAGTGQSDVCPSGWVASRVHKQGQLIDRVALWNAANMAVALPEEANHTLYPINLSDLPDERVSLNCGATFQNHTIASRVFLPDGTGTYRYADSLTWERIQFFGGDGSGITYDGKIWRNGKSIPLKKLSGLYNTRLAEGYEIHPVRANKNGVYLVGLTSPEMEYKGALLYPIQIVSANGQTATELKVGKMDDGSVHALIRVSNEVSDSKLNIDLDRDRFYIRIPGLTGDHDVKVKLGTADNLDSEYDDDPTWVALVAKNGYYESRSQLLVSGDVDDDHTNSIYDLGEDDPSDESNQDRTHKVQLGGYVQITAVKIDGVESSCFMEIPVKVKKTVIVDVVVMSPAGITPERITADFNAVNERYAQVGLRVKRNAARFKDAEEIPGFPRSFRDGADYSSANTLDVDTGGIGAIPTKARMLIEAFGTDSKIDDIHAFYVEGCTGGGVNQGTSIPEYRGDVDPGFSNNFFISRNYAQFRVVAHELGHVLTNEGHWFDDYGHSTEIQWHHNLMRVGGNSSSDVDKIWRPKRLYPLQEDLIWNHRSVR